MKVQVKGFLWFSNSIQSNFLTYKRVQVYLKLVSIVGRSFVYKLVQEQRVSKPIWQAWDTYSSVQVFKLVNAYFKDPCVGNLTKVRNL